jgi:hypothetical protein
VHVVEDVARAGDVTSGLEVEGTAVVTESWEGDTVEHIRMVFDASRVK